MWVSKKKKTRARHIIFSLPVCVAACGRTNKKTSFVEFQILTWPWSFHLLSDIEISKYVNF